jgi:c(7)-type cytochrome triheme protein
MKLAGILAVFAALMLSIGNVMAMPAGKIEFAGGDKGKVTFDAKAHADKGLKCPECHTKPKLFEMKKGKDKFTMADMNEGKFCGACHDGKKAFSVKTEADCAKCHKAGGAVAGADAGAGGSGGTGAGSKAAKK